VAVGYASRLRDVASITYSYSTHRVEGGITYSHSPYRVEGCCSSNIPQPGRIT